MEMLGIEPRASYMRSKRSPTELHPLSWETVTPKGPDACPGPKSHGAKRARAVTAQGHVQMPSLQPGKNKGDLPAVNIYQHQKELPKVPAQPNQFSEN